MAKRRQQQWSKKSKTLPSASKRKEQIDEIISRFKDGTRTKSKTRTKPKVKQKEINYGPRVEQLKAKSKKTKPMFDQKYRDKLLEFGKETKKSRKRVDRHKWYDMMVEGGSGFNGVRQQTTEELVEYYNSEKAQDMIRRRKKASGTYKSPLDSKYYTDYIKPYLELKEINKSLEEKDKWIITDKIEEENQMAMRNWLSNRVTIEEFEQSFKVFEQGEELISELYKGSKYNGTNVTLDDYKSTFYSIFRNMLQKSKSQYDSNTVRTYLLGNGIDEYVDEEGLTPDKLDEIAKVMGPKIDLVRGDIDQLSDLLEGNEPPKKHRKLIDIKEDTEVGDDKTWFDDKDKMQYFKGSRLGDMDDKDLEDLSEVIETKGELKSAQKLIARARIKMKENFGNDTVDIYIKAHDIIVEHGDTLGISKLTDKLVDEIEYMELSKNIGLQNK